MQTLNEFIDFTAETLENFNDFTNGLGEYYLDEGEFKMNNPVDNITALAKTLELDLRMLVMTWAAAYDLAAADREKNPKAPPKPYPVTGMRITNQADRLRLTRVLVLEDILSEDLDTPPEWLMNRVLHGDLKEEYANAIYREWDEYQDFPD